MSISAPQQPKAAPVALVRPALLGALTAPWVAHALVTHLSAIGAHPLTARGAATGIIVVTVLITSLVMWFFRHRTSDTALHPVLDGLGGHLAAALSATAVVATAAGVLAAVSLPLVAYDALGYRLPVVADWLDAGRIAWVTTDDPVRNGYPLGQEAVGALLAAATASTRVVALPSFLYVVAGALSIWFFVERVGVRRAVARAAAALFLLAPIVVLNAPTGYVDASFAGAVVASFLLSALAFGESRPDFVVAAAAGMSLSHALSLKGTGVSIVLAVAVAVVVAVIVERRTSGSLPGFIAARLVVVATFAAPGAFWLIRDFVHTGNPLWPIAIRVAGHELLRGTAPLAAILDVTHNTPAALAGLHEPHKVLYTWLEWAGPAVAFDDRLAGLGLAWPLVALPSLAFVVVRLVNGAAPREQRGPLAMVLLATAVAFALQPMRWWPRYTVWLWGAGAVAFASAAESLIVSGRERVLSAVLALVTTVVVAEGGIAVFHANGIGGAVARSGIAALLSFDPRIAPNAPEWVDAGFWKSGLADASDVCRGAWKPGTDDAILDGVFAQLSPRPRVHVVPDDDGDWTSVQKAWKDAGCADLLLLRGSPVLSLAESDPEVTVEPAVAFDPLFIVRPRRFARLAARNQSP